MSFVPRVTRRYADRAQKQDFPDEGRTNYGMKQARFSLVLVFLVLSAFVASSAGAEPDGVPPKSTITTPDGQVMRAGDEMTGYSTDDSSGVQRVYLYAHNQDGRMLIEIGRYAATHWFCNGSCALRQDWRIKIPDLIPGRYTLEAYAVDEAGNIESPPAVTTVLMADSCSIHVSCTG